MEQSYNDSNNGDEVSFVGRNNRLGTRTTQNNSFKPFPLSLSLSRFRFSFCHRPFRETTPCEDRFLQWLTLCRPS